MTNPSLCYHHFAGIYHRFRSAAFSDYLPMFYGYLPKARCGTQPKGMVQSSDNRQMKIANRQISTTRGELEPVRFDGLDLASG